MNTSTAPPAKRKWLFPLLWVNLSVVIVFFFQFAANQFSNFRGLLQPLAYALVYANLTGVLGILSIGGFAERLAHRRLPLTLVVMVGILLTTASGCLLAQTILMVLGIVIPHHFWGEYFGTLRIAMPLAAVFGL